MRIALNSSEPAPIESLRDIYTFVGGMPAFERIVDAFYRRVEADVLLRPMYPSDLVEARRHLALFLAQYFGGPEEYSAERGHPRLRLRHQPFKIGLAERNAWLANMLAALDEAEVHPAAKALMTAYFEDTSLFLMNSEENK